MGTEALRPQPHQVERFLVELFGDAVGPEACIVIFDSATKNASFCPSPSSAAETYAAASIKANAYFGVSLQSRRDVHAHAAELAAAGRKLTEAPRGYASTAKGIGGVWLDVDVDGPGHNNKKRYPPTKTAALELIMGLPHRPSRVLWTGGGYHAWWIFKEPWIFDSHTERARAETLVHGWQKLAQKATAYDLDSTFDLARLMRAPGTLNHKYGEPVSQIELQHELLYTPDQFEDWLMELPEPARMIEGEFTLSADLNPPDAKLHAMIQMHPQFGPTWRRERKDLPSQSEYDLALASMAVGNGWSLQDTVALIVAHRRIGTQNLKIDRPDYYRSTIAKAGQKFKEIESVERLTEIMQNLDAGISPSTPIIHVLNSEDHGAIAEAAAEAKPAINGAEAPNKPVNGTEVHVQDPTVANRTVVIEHLREALGIPITRLVRYTAEQGEYRLCTDDCSVEIGGIDNIMYPERFRSRIADGTRKLPPRFERKDWDPILKSLLFIVEEIDLGVESSASEQATVWLSLYLNARKPIMDRERAAKTSQPFWFGRGRVAVFSGNLREWLRTYEGENMSSKILSIRLREIGCTPSRMRVTDHGKIKQMKKDEVEEAKFDGPSRLWIVPKDLVPPQQVKEWEKRYMEEEKQQEKEKAGAAQEA